ncbi:MAG: radical SAM protein [Deltaproteobacteria bacterium]|nr:radical SAM protein [Deltaproteobacteria bacterium]
MTREEAPLEIQGADQIKEEKTADRGRSLDAIHLVLTYRCTNQCRHCFCFGAPGNRQVFSFAQVERYIEQIAKVPGIQWVFFEGGEPFVYFPLLSHGLRLAKQAGLQTAVVTNGYFITNARDFISYLRVFRDLKLDVLQISMDQLHHNRRLESIQARLVEAANRAGILCQFLGVSVPEPDEEPLEARRGSTIVDGQIVFRGRAAHGLERDQAKWLWSSFDECPHERLDDPYRVHVDMYGEVQVCQGISIGNMEQQKLVQILDQYVPSEHPIVGPLIEGGPAELITRYDVPHARGYADACHLCYSARRRLLDRFPHQLLPRFLYGGGAATEPGRSSGPEASGDARKQEVPEDAKKPEMIPEGS